MSHLDQVIKHKLMEVHDNWRNRTWWSERIGKRVNSPIQQLLRSREDTIEYLDEEWDVLIVLDACRADLFKETVEDDLFDQIETVTSPATETREWLDRTFDGEFGDIVYVGGNPMVSNVRPEAFHDLIEVWRDAWDENTGVIRPRPVTEAALAALEQYPNKRLIIHYMQPHAPFIGYPDLNFSGDADEWELEVGEAHPNYEEHVHYNNPWEALEAGVINVDDVWEAYKHTLEVVMQDVESLIQSTDRQIVVTSDHGNAFGERSWPIPVRLFGHPGQKRHAALTEVPWASVKGKHCDITVSEVGSTTEASEREVEERLAALGYAEE